MKTLQEIAALDTRRQVTKINGLLTLTARKGIKHSLNRKTPLKAKTRYLTYKGTFSSYTFELCTLLKLGGFSYKIAHDAKGIEFLELPEGAYEFLINLLEWKTDLER